MQSDDVVLLAPADDSKPVAIPPQKGTVADYFYAETELVCGCLTRAGLLWVLNLAGMIFHGIMVVVTIVVSTQDGRGLDTPTLKLYTTNLTWTPDSDDMLTPRFQATEEGLRLSWVCILFFALSCTAHAFVVFTSYRGAMALRTPSNRRVTNLENMYFEWIFECRAPHRWIEYSLSAPTMAMVLTGSVGLAHVYNMASNFVLLWCTMTYGWMCERINRPLYQKGKSAMVAGSMAKVDDVWRPVRWQLNYDSSADKFAFWFLPPRTRAAFERMWPSLLGWVPYATVWAQVFHIYFSTADAADTDPPEFVTAIIVSQAAFFSTFGFAQLILTAWDDGPKYYFAGEVSYLLLSLLSKSVLGFILLFNVIFRETFEEASREAVSEALLSR